MNVDSQLKNLGLHNSEIKIYLFLIRNGLSTLSSVSRGTQIGRTNCYKIFSELESKSLIEKQIVEDKAMYSALDPKSIIEYANKNIATAVNVNKDLQSMYKQSSLKPQVTFYEGELGINELLKELVRVERVEVYSNGNLLSQISNSLSTLREGKVVVHDVKRGIANSFIIWKGSVGIIANSKAAHITVITNADFQNSIKIMLDSFT